MKFAKFSFLFFVFAIGFAGTNTLPLITETIRTKASMENLRQALVGDIVPRDSAGVACSGCASLGTDDFKWGGIFVDLNGTIGGFRQHNGPFSYQEKDDFLEASISSTTVYADKATIPNSSTTFLLTEKRSMLIKGGCRDVSGTNEFPEMESGGTRTLWVRLGRQVGNISTPLNVYTFERNVTSSDVTWPTSGFVFLDVNPPVNTEFSYYLEFSAPGGGGAVIQVISCLEVLSI